MDVLDKTINSILDDGTNLFISGRYPFTYAYDFFRSHSSSFGYSGALSRADASAAVREYADKQGIERFDVILRLADAYIAEDNIVVSEQAKKDALVEARHEYWKACGLSQPGPAPTMVRG